ncbi:MAG: hypothetical protein Q8Q09_00020 [Deltaproteobacteria bacterium]|nr:hypothetical protein [Deltaproteobacteria bacterium]
MWTVSRCWLMALCALVVGCGVRVDPMGDGSGPDASGDVAGSGPDGQRLDGAGPANVCLPLVMGCDERPELCQEPCGQCRGVVVARGNPQMNDIRRITDFCMPRDRRSLRPLLNGAIACDEPREVAYAFEGDGDLGAICLSRELCLAVQALTPELASNESVRICRSADGTAATGAAIRTDGICDPARNLCSADPNCRCGAGKVCTWISEFVHGQTGMCLPPTNGELGESIPCRGGPNRVQCRPGLACMRPWRLNIGLRDEDRWGVCVEPAMCNEIPEGVAINCIPPR